MYHLQSNSVSLSLLVAVMIAAGNSATVQADLSGGGALRLARILPDEPAFQCIAASEFSIAGLKLHDDIGALASLGSPNSMTRGFGEDDGGGYVATTYHYGGLEVDMVRDRVDRIEARSPHWQTKAGLKASMKRDEAIALMGREPDAETLHNGFYSFASCPVWRDGELVWDNAAQYFEFGFGEDGRLAFLRLIADRP